MNDEIRLNELLNKIYYEYLDSHEAEEFIIYFKRLKNENERLKEEQLNLKSELANMWECKARNEEAIDFVKKESKKCYSNRITDNPTKVIGNFMWHTDKLLNILNGGDKE